MEAGILIGYFAKRDEARRALRKLQRTGFRRVALVSKTADGVVYQKDLGEKTDVLAKTVKEYNPDSSWQKAEEQQEETAGDPKTQ